MATCAGGEALMALGLLAAQWLALLTAATALLLMVDTFVGHYRSGFQLKVQYVPLVVGALLVMAALVATVWSGAGWSQRVLGVASALALLAGFVGTGVHHVHGIPRRPGGYAWWKHHVMYGPPPLAPLGLSAVGAVGALAAAVGLGQGEILGIGLRGLLLGLVAVSLAGAAVQAALLHFRGAFNNPAMYLPLTAPVFAALAVPWVVASRAPAAVWTLAAALVLTFLAGFVGLGMHLRGFDRMMGGLAMGGRNVMSGPPVAAPALFAGFSAVGLVGLFLL
jgi:hypothetical protein